MSTSYGHLYSRKGAFKDDKDDKEGDGNNLKKAFDLCDTDKSGEYDCVCLFFEGPLFDQIFLCFLFW